MAQQEIKINLEVKVSGVVESFEVSVEPGSYVSDLINDTLEQCGISNIPPDQCQLILFTKTSAFPLEDEDLFNSIYTTVDDHQYKNCKLVLKDVEKGLNILKVYFHDREDHRIKYSFVVDERTTVEMINDSMVDKLQVDKSKYTYKLVNCVPAKNDHELNPTDIPLLMDTDYLEFRISKKTFGRLPPTPPKSKHASKSTNRSLKQLKRRAKKQSYSLPNPPLKNKQLLQSHRSDTVTTLYSSDSADECGYSEEDPSYKKPVAAANSSELIRERAEAWITKKKVGTMGLSDIDGETKPIQSTATAVTSSAENQRHKFEREIRSLKVDLNKKSDKLHSVEVELCIAQESIKNKQIQLAKYEKELRNVSNELEEKQQAINTLSDILNCEQQENEQLRNQSSRLDGTLYQDLFGRIALTVEIDGQSLSACPNDFSYETVAAPVSSCGSYVVITRVKSSITSLQVGDIILEVNGHPCRGFDFSAAMQQLDECKNELRLVIARPQLQSLSSSESGDEQLDSPPPLPLSPLPSNGLTSSTSLDIILGTIVDKTNSNSMEDNLLKLKNEYEKLQEIVKETQSRETILRDELQVKEKDNCEAILHVANLEATLKNEKSEKDQFTKKCQEAEKTKDRLMNDLQQAREQLISLKKASEDNENELSIKLSILKKEYEALQKEYKDKAATLEEVTYKQQAMGLDVQLEQEEKAKDDESTNKAAKQTKVVHEESETDATNKEILQQQLTRFQSEIEELTKTYDGRLEKLATEINIKDREKKNSDEQIEKQEKEKEALMKQLDASKLEIQRTNKALEEVCQKLKSHEEDTKQLQDEKEMLSKEVKQAKKQEEKSKREMSENHAKKLNDLQLQHLEVLQQKERELQNAQKNAATLQLKVQTLETLQHDRMALLESDLQNFRKHSEKKEDKITEKDDQITQLHFSLKELNLEQQKEAQLKMKQFEDVQTELLSCKEKVQILELEKKMQQEKLTVLDNDLQSLRNQNRRKDETIAAKDGQITELHTTMKELNTELRLLQQQVSSEKEKFERSQSTLAKAESQCQNFKQQLKKYESEIETVTKECNGLKKEKESLEKMLEKQNAAFDQEKTASKTVEHHLNQEINSLKAKAEFTKKQLEASQNEALMYKNKAEALISTMEKDLQSTRQQSEKKDESVTEKDSQIIKLYSMMDQLNIEIKSLQTELQNKQDEVLSTFQSLKSKSSEVATLQASKEESISLIQKLESEVERKSNELNKNQQEAAELKLNITELESSKAHLQAENAKLKSDFEKQLQEMETSIQTLEPQLLMHKNEKDSLTNRNIELSKQISESEQASNALKKELAEVNRKSGSDKAKLENEKQEIAVKLASVEQQLATINGDLVSQKQSYASLESKTNTLYEQLNYIRTEKEKVDEKFTNAIKELERTKADFAVAKTESEEKLKTSQKLLAEKEKDIETQQSLLQLNEEKIEELKTEKSLLLEKIERITTESENELQRVKTSLTAEADQVKEQMQSLTKELLTLQDSNSELLENVNSSREEIKMLTKNGSDLQEHLDKLKQEYDTLEKTKEVCTETLLSERKASENKIQEINEQNKRLQEDLESKLRQAKIDSEQAQENLRKELEKSIAEGKRLIKEIDQHKAQIDTRNAEIKSLNEYIARLLPVVIEFKPSVLAV